MKEIKFRAYVDETMYYDVAIMNNQAYRLNYIEGEVSSYSILENADIMQYTGLKDKNGKEIYEGDIVRTALGHLQLIVWSDMYAAFVAEYPNGDRPYRVDCTDEVIGNIHENPELLEGYFDQTERH